MLPINFPILGKFGGNGGTKSTWADTTPSSADLWNAGSVKGGASRGPPPGIKGSQSWGTGQSRSGGSNWGGNGSPWLLLRNLSPQVLYYIHIYNYILQLFNYINI